MLQDGNLTISQKEFNQLAGFLRTNYGISLSNEKKALVVGRLGNIIAQQNFNSFAEYFEYVFSDPTGKALATLMDKITTNHTFFLREANHFNYFKNQILPYLVGSVADRDLRIWSAGCSSGEEPYTLAMVIDEFFRDEKPNWNTKILATDISTSALGIATKAEYTDEQLEKIPKYWRATYFRRIGGQSNALIDSIKNDVIYRRFNLMEKAFPFKKKFHIIFCRNVMIYFDNKTKQELIDKFYAAMEPGGYLLIGHSETLKNLESKFKYIQPAIYRKE